VIRSLRAELTKIGHWPAYWALLALWAILAIVFGYVTPYLAYVNPVAGVSALAQQTALAGLLPAQIVGKSIPGYPVFGGVIALAIGALAMGSEFGWGTWTTILLQEPGRARVVAGKILALLIAVGGQVLVGFSVALVASTLIALAQRAPIAAPDVTNLLSGVLVAWLIVAVWAALGALLGAALRSTAMPIGLGFVYLLLEELVSGLAGRSALIATFTRLLPGTSAGSLASSILPTAFGPTAPGMNTLIAGPEAALVLLLYALVAGGLTGAIITLRDVR
jgi:ABC-type transport system involved in multi-copper enzyme maturation permease subunit